MEGLYREAEPTEKAIARGAYDSNVSSATAPRFTTSGITFLIAQLKQFATNDYLSVDHPLLDAYTMHRKFRPDIGFDDDDDDSHR